jgi:hypothetical protein
MLEQIGAVASRASGATDSDGGGDSAFFRSALHLHLTALVALAVASEEPVTIPRLRALAAGAARSQAELRSEEWQQNSPTAQLLTRLAEEDATETDPEKRATLAEIFAYWTGEFVSLSERARSIIEIMVSMTVQPFLYPPLRQLFTSGQSTITPESCFDGKLVLIDITAQEFGLGARVAGLVWKHAFQTAVVKRNGARGTLRPVALFADEFQYWVTEKDAEYQAVCRSAAGCTVYLTQQRESISRILGETATENLLSNLNTKIFCQNTGATNLYASQLIDGRYVQVTGTSWGGNMNQSEHGIPGTGTTAGISRNEERRAYLEPSFFQRLRRGGAQNGGLVDAVIFVGGKLFGEGGGEPLPYKVLTFRQ